MDDTKPRILPLPREESTDAAREVFAFWGDPDAWENGSKTNVVMVMANHPALAMAYNAFGKHLLIKSTLPVRPRELVVLRVASCLKSEYEWHYHVGYAVNIGLSLEEIAAIKKPDARTGMSKTALYCARWTRSGKTLASPTRPGRHSRAISAVTRSWIWSSPSVTT